MLETGLHSRLKRRSREWAANLVGVAILLAVVATILGGTRRWKEGGKPANFATLNLVEKAEESYSGGSTDSYVEMTLVGDAQQKGALCLDGSPAGYHFRKGFGSGSDNWVIHLEALLTGCSAGGLATFFRCDDFRDLLPKSTNVKCMADAGFFLDEADITGRRFIQSSFTEIFNFQNVGKTLNKECITENQQSDCFFPKKIIEHVKTPFLILNSAYDWWQIRHILIPGDIEDIGQWEACRKDINKCDSRQLQTLHGFRESLLNSLNDYHQKGGSMLINSCYIHCQSMNATTWHSPNSPRINNKTIAESVGDWYFEREAVQAIDCPFPCDATCYNEVLEV